MSSTYILASAAIGQQKIYHNGVLRYAQEQQEGVDAFLSSAYTSLEIQYPRFYKMDRLSQLGTLAAELVLSRSGIVLPGDPYQTGIVLANANASLDTDLRYYESAKEFPSPSLFVYTLPNIVMGEIGIRFNIKGEQAFFIQPVPDIPYLCQYANSLLLSERLQYCLCGWIDVLAETYKVVLLLVGFKENEGGLNEPFTVENFDQLFRLTHG